MNLLYLYGPPATGKLTVAKDVSALTGYHLFHNHLTLDLAREILPDIEHLRFRSGVFLAIAIGHRMITWPRSVSMLYFG
jgi:hypothetical protein